LAIKNAANGIMNSTQCYKLVSEKRKADEVARAVSDKIREEFHLIELLMKATRWLRKTCVHERENIKKRI